jgi:hypothetical protein
MSVIGAAVATGMLAKSAITVGLISHNFDSYLEGTDVLGAPTEPVKSEPSQFQVIAPMFYTQVAAGLTVVALWTLATSLFKRAR